MLYQNELPYDPPTQADWTRPTAPCGWAGYKVADGVRRHQLYGGGVYVFNRNDPSIVTEQRLRGAQRRGIRLHHLLTVNLDAGAIEHVVNDVGARVDSSSAGGPELRGRLPGPLTPRSCRGEDGGAGGGPRPHRRVRRLTRMDLPRCPGRPHPSSCGGGRS